jgi:hypothetical protein
VIPVDIQVENHGTLFLLRPLTEAGQTWLEEHTVGETQWFGGALAVEPRYVLDIVLGAQDDGLEVA